MRHRPIVMLCAIATTVAAAPRVQPEDEAHRLDRLETRRLNEAAAMRLHQVVTVDRPPVPAPAPVMVAPPTSSAAEVVLRRREEQALADWRDRAAVCRSGQRTQC